MISESTEGLKCDCCGVQVDNPEIIYFTKQLDIPAAGKWCSRCGADTHEYIVLTLMNGEKQWYYIYE